MGSRIAYLAMRKALQDCHMQQWGHKHWVCYVDGEGLDTSQSVTDVFRSVPTINLNAPHNIGIVDDSPSSTVVDGNIGFTFHRTSSSTSISGFSQSSKASRADLPIASTTSTLDRSHDKRSRVETQSEPASKVEEEEAVADDEAPSKKPRTRTPKKRPVAEIQSPGAVRRSSRTTKSKVDA